MRLWQAHTDFIVMPQVVDGQNSWELGGVKMGVFEDYFGRSDKIDGN